MLGPGAGRQARFCEREGGHSHSGRAGDRQPATPRPSDRPRWAADAESRKRGATRDRGTKRPGAYGKMMHQAVAPGPGHSVAIAMRGRVRVPPGRQTASTSRAIVSAAKPGECLRSLEIDDHSSLFGNRRQVTRLGTFEDLHDVGSRADESIMRDRPP